MRKRPPNLTLNQAVTVATIRNYIHAHGHAPTLRELAAMLDRSRGTTMQRIRSLERKGVIRKIARAHRTVEITPPRTGKSYQPAPGEDEDLSP